MPNSGVDHYINAQVGQVMQGLPARRGPAVASSIRIRRRRVLGAHENAVDVIAERAQLTGDDETVAPVVAGSADDDDAGRAWLVPRRDPLGRGQPRACHQCSGGKRHRRPALDRSQFVDAEKRRAHDAD